MADLSNFLDFVSHALSRRAVTIEHPEKLLVVVAYGDHVNGDSAHERLDLAFVLAEEQQIPEEIIELAILSDVVNKRRGLFEASRKLKEKDLLFSLLYVVCDRTHGLSRSFGAALKHSQGLVVETA